MSRALLIALSYTGDNALRGPINDLANMEALLKGTFGLNPTAIESEKHEISIDTLKRVVKKANDEQAKVLWLFFAGHGTQVAVNGEDEKEDDGLDEALVTSSSSVIRDNDLRDALLQLDSRCTAVCIFDCCHSASLLDLEHQARLKQLPPRSEVVQKVVSQLVRPGGWAWRRFRGRWYRVRINPLYRRIRVHIARSVPQDPSVEIVANQGRPWTGCNCICISACPDGKSAFGYLDPETNKWQGALTTALCSLFASQNELTVGGLLTQIWKLQKEKGIEQEPAISCSSPLHTDSVLLSSAQFTPILRPNPSPPSSV